MLGSLLLRRGLLAGEEGLEAGARLLCAAGVNKHKAGTMERDAAEGLGLGASDAAAVGGVQVLQWGKAKRR